MVGAEGSNELSLHSLHRWRLGGRTSDVCPWTYQKNYHKCKHVVASWEAVILLALKPQRPLRLPRHLDAVFAWGWRSYSSLSPWPHCLHLCHPLPPAERELAQANLSSAPNAVGSQPAALFAKPEPDTGVAVEIARVCIIQTIAAREHKVRQKFPLTSGLYL